MSFGGCGSLLVANNYSVLVAMMSLNGRSVGALNPSVPLTAGWKAYTTLLLERPLLTKAVTSSVIMTVSDALTQQMEATMLSRPAANTSQGASTAVTAADSITASIGSTKWPLWRRHNWVRSRQSLLTGLVWSGPIAHYWYQLLELLITNPYLKLPSIPAIRLVARIVLDALLFSPFTIFGFFTVSTLINGGTLRDVGEKLRTRWRRALNAAWSFWPIVNIANFSLVPLAFRVLYANVMSLLWTGYLSYVNNLQKQQV